MPRYIELFAGSGGMSLGLESLGFELLFANELSPMAAETFAFNHLGVNLQSDTGENTQRVTWISSSYPRDKLKKRLDENPLDGEKPFSDLSADFFTNSGRLLIGNIAKLNDFLENSSEGSTQLLRQARIDLVSGGPPCQSFSMAGLRELTNSRNRLPWEFARLVNIVKPKIALLENVSGILRPFHRDGQEYFAWKEVAKAFVEIGYAPICLHVNAKYVGAPQNRPRFLMIAINGELRNALKSAHFDSGFQPLLDQALMALDGNVDWGEFRYWDIAKDSDRSAFKGSPLSPLHTHQDSSSWRTASDAISDLSSKQGTDGNSEYLKCIAKTFPGTAGETPLKNHEKRAHSEIVRQRFRLFQVLESMDERVLANQIASAIRSNPDGDRLVELISPLMKHPLLFQGETRLRRARSMSELIDLMTTLQTKKHSQRALVSSRPAPAALSIPDDCCHYSPKELRTLTVREMARFQTFPDWFEFRSKVTTGGNRRKFEVPQYTQVGNAVPPLLARQAGEVVNKLLNAIEP